MLESDGGRQKSKNNTVSILFEGLLMDGKIISDLVPLIRSLQSRDLRVFEMKSDFYHH